ncbi:MAG: RidA family protein [Tissierellia bacterium]|nr:RidA family protein [Tissierellia bacterium]
MKIIQTTNAPKALGPYSQGIQVDRLIFTSGQLGIIPDTGELAGEDVASQTDQVLKNLSAILQESGTSLDKVFKTTCFLLEMKDFEEFNRVYEGYFNVKPARSCVAVKEMAKGALIEIEAIAVCE